MKAVFDAWKPKPHQFQAFSHAGNRSHRDLHAAHSLHNRSLPDLPYDCRSLPLHHFVRTFDLWELHISSWEIGNQIPIAGNVDPVQVVMNGTKEEIDRAVAACIQTGEKAKRGYHLATGCDIPEKTDPAQIDWFMEAVRNN